MPIIPKFRRWRQEIEKEKEKPTYTERQRPDSLVTVTLDPLHQKVLKYLRWFWSVQDWEPQTFSGHRKGTDASLTDLALCCLLCKGRAPEQPPFYLGSWCPPWVLTVGRRDGHILSETQDACVEAIPCQTAGGVLQIQDDIYYLLIYVS